jgi:hypothetical protein
VAKIKLVNVNAQRTEISTNFRCRRRASIRQVALWRARSGDLYLRMRPGGAVRLCGPADWRAWFRENCTKHTYHICVFSLGQMQRERLEEYRLVNYSDYLEEWAFCFSLCALVWCHFVILKARRKARQDHELWERLVFHFLSCHPEIPSSCTLEGIYTSEGAMMMIQPF